jgi:hypothetical protein
MLTLMERQTRLAECLGTQLTKFGMSLAKRRAAVVALGSGLTSTRRAECVLEVPRFDHSTVAHK